MQESVAQKIQTQTVPLTGAVSTVKVASYNIHRCLGTDRRYDPGRIAAVIRRLNADLIGLQEVDSRLPGGRGMVQLDYLASAMKCKAVPGPCIIDDDGHYGNALLTRLPVVGHRLIDLSVKGREPRGALDLDVILGSSLLRVIVTHLGCRSYERRKQIRKLLEHLEGNGKRRTVIMGDFNEWSLLGRGIRAINSQIGLTFARPTFPSFFPVFPLDRIWALEPSDKPVFRIEKSFLARTASDHLPITATIKF